MKLLVYCQDYAPNETGFAIAFTSFCEALARHYPSLSIDVLTPAKAKGQGRQMPGNLRVFRLCEQAQEVYNMPVRQGFAGKLCYGGQRLRTLGAMLVNRFAWKKELVRLNAENAYDVVLFESCGDPFLIGILPRAILCKLVIRFHSTGDTEFARYQKSVYAALIRLVISHRIAPHIRGILATSYYHLNFIRSFYYRDNPLDCAERYFGVVDNVVDDFVGAVPGPASETEVRRLVMLGRMDQRGVIQKGFEDVLAAMAGVSEEVRSRLDLEIIGSGPYKDRLEAMRQQLGLQNIRFVGQLPNAEVRRRLIGAHVVVLPSRFEGRSVFAIEGLLSGCSPLFTRTGGLADLVNDHGWQVDVQDIEGLTKAFTAISQTSVATLLTMGAAARQSALAQFNDEAVARAGHTHLLNIYTGYAVQR